MVFLYGIYSWMTNLAWGLAELLPFPIRNIFFKICFGRYGRGSFIDYGCYMRYTSQIYIGEHCSINRGTKIYASHYHNDVKIEIGNHVALGPEVCLFSAGHNYHCLELPDTAASIVIGDNAWVGGRSIILPGITIGEGAVVGAGSVVTKDVEPFSIVCGNPAKKVKMREISDD